MSDVKNLLKFARDAINEKKFEDAQNHCKTILKKDKQNYMALVLLGVALQNSDQASMAFKKAISLDKNKLLAWQGLENYYEKNNSSDSCEKLLQIYSELLDLQLEENKFEEICVKIKDIGIKSNLKLAIEILWNHFQKNGTNKDILKKMLESLIKNENIVFQPSNLLLTIIEYFIAEDNYDDILLMNYARVLEKQVSTGELVEKLICSKTMKISDNLKKWLITFLLNKYVNDGDDTIIKHTNVLLLGIENSYEDQVLKSVNLYNTCSYADAYKNLVPFVNIEKLDTSLIQFLINCLVKMNKWDSIEKLIQRILPYVTDDCFLNKITKYLFTSYYMQSNYREAFKLGEQIDRNCLNQEELSALAHCAIEEEKQVDDVLKLLEHTEYHKPLIALKLWKECQYDKSIELLESFDCDSFLKWLVMGKCFLDAKQFDKCLMPLLKAAKSNPYSGDCFLYLGHYYYQYANDLEKAKKCYQKAYSLCGITIAVQNLSKLYQQLKNYEENYQLLTSLVKKPGGDEYWSNLQLGLYHLSQRQWNDAIIYLRNVIRIKSDSSEIWESLADAYYYRGSYTSAIKCYQKVIDLSESFNSYAMTQLASIQNLLQDCTNAVKSYEKVLMQDPKSIVALKGLADAWYDIAEERLSLNLYGAVQFSAQRCIIYITEALKICSDYECLWHQLAGALIILTKLPEKYATALIDNILFGISDDRVIRKKKNELFEFAIACYSKCIDFRSDALTYYDLSLAYFEYFKSTSQAVLCRIALVAAQHCVKLTNNQWIYWNHLGVIYMSSCINRLDLAQHCFIKALNCDQTNANSWSNLGILYVKLGLHVLANNAFKRAQQSDPNCLFSWIGQAIIAEKVQEEEAMDLFRHAAQLGFHRESAFGYSDWVCQTLQKYLKKKDLKYRYAIENMHAIPVALDLMVWLCEYETSNSCALTLKGLLEERMFLQKSAFKSFSQARDFQKSNPHDALLINLGRIQLKFDEYEKAIENFKNVQEGSLESVCGLAYAYQKLENYEECYSTYNAAIHWLANSDQDKADLFVAMASMMYSLQNFDDAKTLLFQSIQICPQKPSAATLFATCALGLLHSDPSLSKLALSEIKHYEFDSTLSFDVGYLKSFLLYKENKINQALRAMSASIHKYPDVSQLWYCLGNYHLQEDNLNPKRASIFTQKALASGRGQVDITKLLAVASVSEQLCGNIKKGLTLALKALHVYPQRAENWAALISILLPKSLVEGDKKWLKELISFVRQSLNCQKSLSLWLGVAERLIEQSLR